MLRHSLIRAGIVAAIAAAPATGFAEFDPSSALMEAPGVSARYPDPPIAYATPAFATGKQGFTSQAELMAFLRSLLSQAPLMRLDADARSPEAQARVDRLLGGRQRESSRR